MYKITQICVCFSPKLSQFGTEHFHELPTTSSANNPVRSEDQASLFLVHLSNPFSRAAFKYLACCATYHHLPKLQKAARADTAHAAGRRKGTHSCLGSDADTCPCCKYSSDTGPAEVCSSIFNYSKHYLYVEGVRFKKQNQINKQNKQTSDEAYFPMLSL